MATYSLVENMVHAAGNPGLDSGNEVWRLFHDRHYMIQNACGSRVSLDYASHPAPTIPGSFRLVITLGDGRAVDYEVVPAVTSDATSIRATTGSGFFTTLQLTPLAAFRRSIIDLVIRYQVTSWSIIT